MASTVLREPEISQALRAAAMGVLADPENPQAIKELGYALFEHQALKPAGFVLGVYESLAVNPEPGVKLLLAHCHREEGEQDKSASALASIETWRSTTHAPNDDSLERSLRLLYMQASAKFVSGGANAAKELYRMLVPFDPYAKSIGLANLGAALFAPTSKEERFADCEQTLLRAESTWQNQQSPWPQFATPTPGTNPDLIDKRVLLLVRGEPSDEHGKFIPHLMGSHLESSASALKMKCQVASNDCLNNEFEMPWAARELAIKDVLARIDSFQPHLVVVDNFAALTHSSPLSMEAFADFYKSMRALCSARLVGYYLDPWIPAQAQAAIDASRFIDAAWHTDPAVHLQIETKYPGKSICLPIPFPLQPYEEQNVEESLGAAFVGRCESYNYLRALWLFACSELDMPAKLVLTNAFEGGLPPYETYARLLLQSTMSLQFSARNEREKVMCWRAWESIYARSLVLEEDNPHTPHFLVPHVHYVPFSTVSELDLWLRFFEQKPGWRLKLVEQAQAFTQEFFGHGAIWRRVLGH